MRHSFIPPKAKTGMLFLAVTCNSCGATGPTATSAVRATALWEAQHVPEILRNPVAVHINMLRGTIAWTKDHLRHLIGEAAQDRFFATDPAQIDEIIDHWHNGELLCNTLHEALGWTELQYARWVESGVIPAKD